MRKINHHIGKKIKKLRKHRNLTQVQLAKKTGVSERTIQYIESGNANPTLELIANISKALDCTLEITFTH